MRKILAALVIAAAAITAAAQDFVVSTGGDPKESTYSQMFDELNGTCGSTMKMALSSGSIENLERLAANKVSGGIVQTDVLWLRGRLEKLDNLKTLVTLHPEEVHVAVSSGGLKPEGMNPFASKVQPRDVSDLKNRKVASWGGSMETARILNELLDMKWQLFPFTNAGQAKTALEKGEVEVLVAVGGSPHPALSSFGPAWRLVPFSANDISRLKDVYVPATLNYSKMNSMGIQTVATEALLVVQNYRSPVMTSRLSKVRSCLATNIDMLRETVGMHPKWRAVDPTNKGKWNWYEAK